MSKLVKFFIAADDVVAALALRGGPARALESVSWGNFDPEEAVIEWESLFTGRRVEELMDADEPRIVAGQDNDGYVVFAFSDRLVSVLGAAGLVKIGEVAVLWSQVREQDGEALDVDVAGEILGDLARLARAAERQGSGVYCWVA
ncbi:hypothetical protein [Streptomyces sp. NPDC056549]|uniref:hypothetical protein n=1 Tax=Streptomyces sp. NPDC056549 TaxID=3345864 RepID=UPI00367ABFC2